MPDNMARDNGHKLKDRKFHLNMRKHFFTVRVTNPWNRFPGQAVDSPSLEIFKTLTGCDPVEYALSDPV